MYKDEKYYMDLENEYNEILIENKKTITSKSLEKHTIQSYPIIVSEGDSWFEFGRGRLRRIGRDIIHQLRGKFNYTIENFAKAGDTLENMVYGTEINKNYELKKSQWWETKRAIEEYKPDIFLFSGGGNDFSGLELSMKLNHRLTNNNNLRIELVDYIFDQVVPETYNDLFKNVWDIDDNIEIIIHGYGVPRPDGRGVKRVGFTWAGPWLLPYLAEKGYTDPVSTQEIMLTLVNKFNEALKNIVKDKPKVHYLDLRKVIEPRDWEDELHLSDDAFYKVAKLYDEKIKEIRNSNNVS